MASERAYPDRPLVGVGAVVLRGSSVLLVRRGRAPLLGALSFPGGGQKLGETVEETARRELMEETGIEAGPLTLAGHADVVDRDGSGMVRHHYTVLNMAGPWLAGEPRAGGDAAETMFVAVERLTVAGLDAAHRTIVRIAVGLQRRGR